MARGEKAEIGATRVSPNGYPYIKTKDGWEIQGRIVAAKMLGRPLEKGERVSYKDGNPLNFAEDNIEIRQASDGLAAKRRRLAQLEGRRDDLDAQIMELEDEIKELES